MEAEEGIFSCGSQGKGNLKGCHSSTRVNRIIVMVND